MVNFFIFFLFLPKHLNSRRLVLFSKMLKTIKVKERTHSRLKEVGQMGETFDSLFNRLIDEFKKNNGEGG